MITKIRMYNSCKKKVSLQRVEIKIGHMNISTKGQDGGQSQNKAKNRAAEAKCATGVL